MTRIDVLVADEQFAHAINASNGSSSVQNPYINWVRDEPSATDTKLYTDTSLKQAQTDYVKNKIAWLLESPIVTRRWYKWVQKNEQLFAAVLTFDQALLERNPDLYKLCPAGGTWIDSTEQYLYDKNKNISIIASGKKRYEGQKLRHKIIRRYQSRFDGVFGFGYQPVDNKLTALKDYRYSLIIENTRKDYYFSEKLIDALLTGVIPIYWGCPSIDEFFNIDGILSFKNIKELDTILENMSEQDYMARYEAIKDNFQRAQSYRYTEFHVKNILAQLAL